jgi:phosphatidylglycerophosphatase A
MAAGSQYETSFNVAGVKNNMNSFRDSVRAALCTALGFGYSPFAPGTVGTFPAVGIYLVIALFAPQEYRTPLIAVALAVSCVLSVALGRWAEKHWGRKDPRHFVLDEVAGFLLTVLLFQVQDPVVTAVWAFLVTRAFDILKPWPASKMEVLPAGWGILLDDLVSSLYAALALHAAYYAVPMIFPTW